MLKWVQGLLEDNESQRFNKETTNYLTNAINNGTVSSVPWLVQSSILNYIHVIEPDVLHAAREIAARKQPLTDLKKVVQPAKLNLEPKKITVSFRYHSKTVATKVKIYVTILCWSCH